MTGALINLTKAWKKNSSNFTLLNNLHGGLITKNMEDFDQISILSRFCSEVSYLSAESVGISKW